MIFESAFNKSLVAKRHFYITIQTYKEKILDTLYNDTIMFYNETFNSRYPCGNH